MSVNKPFSRLIIASHNPGKIREISDLLHPYNIDIMTATDLGIEEPEETENTFSANAALKACHSAQLGQAPALSDDSGLVIPALEGAPGVHSARWAEDPQTGKQNFALAMQRVHDELGNKSREAYFICALCLARPDGQTDIYQGRVDGQIVWPPRGKHGFGYDPIFQAHNDQLTFGEHLPADKHAKSHRAKAFTHFITAHFPSAPYS